MCVERSPFENSATTPPGKADAAWEEDPQPAATVQKDAPAEKPDVVVEEAASVASGGEPTVVSEPVAPQEEIPTVAPEAPPRFESFLPCRTAWLFLLDSRVSNTDV